MVDNPLAEKLKKLRVLIETQAEMCFQLIDTALAELQDVAEEEDESLKCPECGERDEDKLEESTVMGGPTQITCLECGASHYPGLPAERTGA